MNLTVTLFWILTLVLLAWQGVTSYGALPAQLTTKFDMSGEGQGMTSKESFYLTWYAVIAVLNGMVFLIRSIMRYTSARYVNVPNKEYWFSTSERRLVCTNRMTNLMMFMFAMVNAQMALLFQSIVEYNLTKHATLPIWLPVVGVPVIVLLTMVAMMKTFRIPEGTNG